MFVHVCVCVNVSVPVCISLAIKEPLNGNVVVHDVVLLSEGRRFETNPLANAMNWHIHIWPGPIIKVKVMQISTANVSKLLTFLADITIAIKYEFARALSIIRF